MSMFVICAMFGQAAGGYSSIPDIAVDPSGPEAVGEDTMLELILQGLAPTAREAFRRSAEHDLPDLKVELEPALTAMPANDNGRFGPTTVRYVLHRLFLQKRGWLLKGLDPQGQAWNKTSPLNAVLFRGLPLDVRSDIHAELTGPGLNLNGVATLAALLEHQVHEEDGERLRAVYTMLGLPQGRIQVWAAVKALELYATSYVLGLDPKDSNRTELQGFLGSMDEIYPNWPIAQKSLRATVQLQVQAGYVGFDGAMRVVNQMTDEFFRWQDPACQSMKNFLVAMEDRGTGRVPLADFYNKALHEGKWQLSESETYLRQLGALDESSPRNPRVIIPNYVYGASNCLGTSDHLSICCVSECEGILSSLERGLGAPEASPTDVAERVAALPSSTVAASRTLSSVMMHRLNAIAASHDGRVPLHGRLFAQWLHHAYPRECPYPHLSGQTRPLQTEDWTRVTGQEVTASPSAMARHAGIRPSIAPRKRGPLENAAWSYEEELFVPDARAPTAFMLVHGTVFAAAFAVVAFGFALVRMARSGRKATRAVQAPQPTKPTQPKATKPFVV